MGSSTNHDFSPAPISELRHVADRKLVLRCSCGYSAALSIHGLMDRYNFSPRMQLYKVHENRAKCSCCGGPPCHISVR